MSLLGVLALWSAPAEADGVPTPQQPCPTPASATGVAPQALSALAQLEELIENVPCAGSGQVSYGTTDNLGGSMDVLDPIADPAGGYLGVYHTQFGSHAGEFRISLAQSPDLIHWTRIVVLDPLGASMPTLRPIPGSTGFLLAYEQRSRRPSATSFALYYTTLAALLSGHYAAQRARRANAVQLQQRDPDDPLDRLAHGPVQLGDQFGFHYETEQSDGRGPDREAIGTVIDFRHWSARPDLQTDSALEQLGLHGSHGTGGSSASTAGAGECTRARSVRTTSPPGTCCSRASPRAALPADA